MPFAASESSILLENLATAFQAESNAQARYLRFAQGGRGEGWPGVSCLFRAAAYAEQIHAGNHDRILRQLGGETDFVPWSAEVKTTLENLRAALAGELFEVDTMYPAFAEQARQCRDVAVVRTFTWALEAEKTHVRLFNEALRLVQFDQQESWGTTVRDFYVFPVCGHTSEHEHATGNVPGVQLRREAVCGTSIAALYRWLSSPAFTLLLNSADLLRGTLNDCQPSQAKCLASSTIWPT
jgi:rubrerythrin